MRSIGFMATLLAACAPAIDSPRDAVADACAAAGRPAVLYVTHSVGYRHAVLPHSVDLLGRLGAKSGAFHLAWRDDARLGLDAVDLAACAAVVFFSMGDVPLSDGQESALLAFVRGGGGFVGLHSAATSLTSWPEWADLVGARFNGHPWYGRAVVRPVSADHPATRDLPPTWPLNDEIYQFDHLRAGLTHLLRLDTDSVDMSAVGVEEMPWGFPLAWARRFGDGRVFYTALGHGDIWDDARFQAHVLGGIQSVLAR